MAGRAQEEEEEEEAEEGTTQTGAGAGVGGGAASAGSGGGTSGNASAAGGGAAGTYDDSGAVEGEWREVGSGRSGPGRAWDSFQGWRRSLKEEKLRSTSWRAAQEEQERKIALAKTASEKYRVDLAKAKHDLASAQAKTAAQALKKGLQLGGVQMSDADRRALYFGKVDKSQHLYGPVAPKAPFRGMAAAEALRPDVSEESKSLHRMDLGKLRGASEIRVGRGVNTDAAYARDLVTPNTDLRQGLQYGFLRELSMPKGMRIAEQAAYAEIRSNGDRDTSRHVVSELGKLGVSRGEAEAAIKSLTQRGLIRKVVDFSGEPPIYEVVEEAAESMGAPPIQSRALDRGWNSPIQVAAIQSGLMIGPGL
jgi:hypothetical protein